MILQHIISSVNKNIQFVFKIFIQYKQEDKAGLPKNEAAESPTTAAAAAAIQWLIRTAAQIPVSPCPAADSSHARGIRMIK